MIENADEFDSKCSEYVTFAPLVLVQQKRGIAKCNAASGCIQVHYFRSVMSDRSAHCDGTCN